MIFSSCNSSKIRTNKFNLTTMRLVFVRFLEKIEDTKKDISKLTDLQHPTYINFLQSKGLLSRKAQGGNLIIQLWFYTIQSVYKVISIYFCLFWLRVSCTAYQGHNFLVVVSNYEKSYLLGGLKSQNKIGPTRWCVEFPC